MRRETRRTLAQWTTFGLGGPAEQLSIAESDDDLVTLAREGAPLLAGGSNVLIADEGLPQVALVRTTGIALDADGTRVTAAAGETWDTLVSFAVERGLSGIECLSGIPGSVGATPVQNVGAYGQEIADTLTEVSAWDRVEGARVTLRPEDLAFGYRDSALKSRFPGRYVVLSVTFALTRAAPVVPPYRELEAAVAALGAPPDVAALRATVISLRKKKGMVLDPADPDTRSAGSFFTNPVLDAAAFEALLAKADDAPGHASPDGKTKVPAAWLIERAGFKKGHARGGAAISSKHALALTNRADATSADVFALAREIRDGVAERLSVVLEPEPVLLGFRERL